MLYKYKGFHNYDSICDIKVYGNIVVATEIDDNRGTSITNMAEVIATDVAKKYHIKMKDLIWFECYNNPPLNSRVRFEIENKRYVNPTWERVNKEYIQNLIKENEEITASNDKKITVFHDIPIVVRIIIFSVFIIIAVPLFIDYCIIGNSIKSNIDNSDWVSFLGSYIGSIVSSTATLIGILWTIKYTKEQSNADREFTSMQTNEDRRLQCMPFIKYEYKDYKNVGTTLIIAFDDQSNKDVYRNIYFKNIGLGPLIDLVIDIKQSDSVGQQYKTYIIEPGEENQISLEFKIRNEKIKLTTDSDGYTHPSLDISRTRRRTIKVSYRDLVGNQYEQSMTVQLLTNFECINGIWEYSEPTLIIGEPTKVIIKK